MAWNSPTQRSPKVRLPDAIVHDLVERGKRNVEILQILKDEYHIISNHQALSKWRQRNGAPVRMPDPERLELIPWKIAAKHAHDKTYGRLKAEARLRAGKPLTRPAALQRRKLQEMQFANPGMVIHYDRKNGWVLVPRREGIDKDFIRDPRFADNGKRIKDAKLWQ